MKTFYELLGVTAQASPKAIQQAFFRLAKKFDPKSPANHGDADAGAKYKSVHDAFRILSDLELRQAYDRSLQAPTLTQRVRNARALRTGNEKSAKPAGLP
jgi:DnaJ-class molecular chaperone